MSYISVVPIGQELMNVCNLLRNVTFYNLALCLFRVYAENQSASTSKDSERVWLVEQKLGSLFLRVSETAAKL
jgi:hypothetical protein